MSGLWTAFRTRPFSKIPRVDSIAQAVFVNAMETEPLALDPEVVINQQKHLFTMGITLLRQLLEQGPVFICTRHSA